MAMGLHLMQVFLGQLLPAHLQKHCGAAGQGTLVVHFGYYPQTEGLLRYTDVLSRYEEVARTMSRGRERCGLLALSHLSGPG